MIDIGTVTGEEITTNKDGDDDTRLLQVELSNPDDLQTVEQFRSPGDDSSPQPGARVIVLDLGPSYRVAVACDDNVIPSVSPGFKEIYSYDEDSVKMTRIILGYEDTGGGVNKGTLTVSAAGTTITIASDGSVTVTSAGTVDINGYLTVSA